MGTHKTVAKYEHGLDVLLVANGTAVEGLNACSIKRLRAQLERSGADVTLMKRLLRRETSQGDELASQVRYYPQRASKRIRELTRNPPPAPRNTALVLSCAESDRQNLTTAYPVRMPL